MNLKEIKDMINLMKENDLVELELEKEGLRVRLKKRSESDYERVVERIPRAAAALEQAEHEAKAKEVSVHERRLEIKSPMVGTFFRAPSPDVSPFVEVGSVIEPGHVICIVEAMKLMNEIKAEVKGKVVEILAENGEPVEFGQVIFVVEPI